MNNEATDEQFVSVAGELLKGNGLPCDWSSPVTGEEVSFAGAGKRKIDRAVAVAKSAQSKWVAQAQLERQAALLGLADKLDANTERLGRLDTVDMGKPASVAKQEAHVAAFILRFYAGAIDKTCGFVAPSAREALAVSVRQTHGDIGSIISWNYPAINVKMKVAPAMVAGNAIFAKLVSVHTKVMSQPCLDSGTSTALPVEPHGRSGYGTEFGVAAFESYSRRHAIEYLDFRL